MGKILTFGSVFAGIGGFDLGFERAGMVCRWQIEKDEFCQKVLEKHWPHVQRYGDIREVNEIEPVDVICGGFPCQPFSVAGQRRGAEDDRYLWPELLRLVAELRPTWFVGENVAGILSMEQSNCETVMETETAICTESEMVLETIRKGLAEIGYQSQPIVIPACAVGAPHRRDRVWILAHSDSTRKSQPERGIKDLRKWSGDGGEDVSDAKKYGCAERRLPIRETSKESISGIGMQVAAHSTGERLQVGRCPGFAPGGKETATGMESEFERCGEMVSNTHGAGCEEFNTSSQSDRERQFAGTYTPDYVSNTDDRSGSLRRDGELQSAEEIAGTGDNYRVRAATNEPGQWWAVEPGVGRVAHGVPGRVDRIRSLGNAVVPQMVEIIGRYIVEVERLTEE